MTKYGDIFGMQMAFGALVQSLLKSNKLERSVVEAVFKEVDEVIVSCVDTPDIDRDGSEYFKSALTTYRAFTRTALMKAGDTGAVGLRMAVDNDRIKNGDQ